MGRVQMITKINLKHSCQANNNSLGIWNISCAFTIFNIPMKIRFLNLPLLLVLCFPVICPGQQVKNVTFQQEANSRGDNWYMISYDLEAPFDSIACVVKVKLNATGKSFYLEEVQGDVGNLVYPGNQKKIKWDYVKELVHFAGDINIFIEATPCVKIPEKIKKHKPIPVQLAPIYQSKKSYAVKLYRKGKEAVRLNDVLLIENTFTVSLTRKVKPGRKYQLAITDGDQIYFSNAFKIKPRVSITVLAIPVVAAGAYFIISPSLEEDPPLPGPPDPPGG